MQKRFVVYIDRFLPVGLLLMVIGGCIYTFLQSPIQWDRIIQLFIIPLAARYVFYFILWVQLKNSICSRAMLRFFVWFFLIGSAAGSVGLLYSALRSGDILDLIGAVAAISACGGVTHFAVKNHEQIGAK